MMMLLETRGPLDYLASHSPHTPDVLASLAQLPFPVLIVGIVMGAAVLMALFKHGFATIDKLIAKRNEEGSGEEAQLIQEMFAKLNRMEARIESLETIIVDSQRKSR